MNLRRCADMSFIRATYEKDLNSMKSDNEPRERIQNVAWPSEALASISNFNIGECRRAMFYKIIGATPTNPPSIRNKYICDAGNMYEEHHIKRFKDLGIFEEGQKRIEFPIPDRENSVMVVGKVDAIISENSKLKAIEMKSISAWKAAEITGDDRTIPLPATRNLMQVMLYLYYLTATDVGKSLGIDEVYLMYINRSDNSLFYYRVELDDSGYAIITAIDQTGKEVYTINLKDVNGYDILLARPEVSKSYDARLAELKVKISDIFDKFDSAYTYATKRILPPKDYTLSYTDEEVEKQFKCGRISKIKYNKVKKGEQIGDFQCSYCAFFQKCLSESGINFK